MSTIQEKQKPIGKSTVFPSPKLKWCFSIPLPDSIYLDDEILANFREQAEMAGVGYQTLINEALKKHLQSPAEITLTQEDLRRILREELSMPSC